MWDPWSKHNTPAKLTPYDPGMYKSTQQLQIEQTEQALGKVSHRDTTLDDIVRLSGVKETVEHSYGAGQSKNATELAQYQREHNIRPGTDAWFRLWFALPKMTGERPHD